MLSIAAGRFTGRVGRKEAGKAAKDSVPHSQQGTHAVVWKSLAGPIAVGEDRQVPGAF